MLIINRDLFTRLFIYHLFPLKSKVFLVNLMEVRNGWGCEGPLMCTKESRCRKNRVVLWRQTGPALHCLPEGRFSKQCSWCYLFRFSVQNGEKSVVVENEIMQPLVPQHKGRHLGTGSPSDSFFSDKKQYIILTQSLFVSFLSSHHCANTFKKSLRKELKLGKM